MPIDPLEPPTAFKPVYRLRVYESRSASIAAGRNPDLNAAVLTPAAGAPHSEPFQVATKQGIEGFKAVMGLPKGRRSRFDPLTKKTDVGMLQVELLDIDATALTVGNSELWVSSFLGNAQGQLQLAGDLVMVEESLDDGSTWGTKPYYVGKVDTLTLTRPRVYTMQILDIASMLDRPVFATAPHHLMPRPRVSLSPFGLTSPWRDFTVVPPYKVLSAAYALHTEILSTPIVTFVVGAPSPQILLASRPCWMNDAFVKDMDEVNDLSNAGAWHAKDQMRVTFAGGVGCDGKQMICLGGAQKLSQIPGTQTYTNRMLEINLAELLPDDPYYISGNDAAFFGAAGGLKFFVVEEYGPDAVSEKSPLLLEQHPVALLGDLLDGNYSPLSATGEVIGRVAFDATAMASENYPWISMGAWKITEADTLNNFIEQAICLPNGLAYSIEPEWDGVHTPRGVFRLIDTRIDAILDDLGTVESLTDDDLVSDKAPSWQHSRKDASGVVSVTYHIDTQGMLEGGSGIPIARAGSGLFTSKDVIYEEATFDENGSVGGKKIAVDMVSNRVARDGNGWLHHLLGLALEGDALSQATRTASLFAPYARGPILTLMTCLRTPVASSCWPGDWRYNETSYLPDPSTNTRGGKRIMLCVAREEDGLALKLTFLDCGTDGQADEPVLSLADVGTTSGLSSAYITLNADNDYVEVQYAETATTETVPPAASDAAWHAAPLAPSEVEATYDMLKGFTANWATAPGRWAVVAKPVAGRTWVRARSVGNFSKKQPSAWTLADAQDFTPPSAPSSVAVSGTITSRAAQITWTNASATDPVELWLGTTTTDMRKIASLLPGTTTFLLSALDTEASTTHRVAVRHLRAVSGLYSAFGSLVFSTSGASVVAAPAIASLSVSSSNLGLALSAGDRSGIELAIQPGAVGMQIEVWSAPDVSGAPDTANAVLVGHVPDDQARAAGTYFTDAPLAMDGATRWYRTRHTPLHLSAGTFSPWVSAVPVVLKAAGTKDAYSKTEMDTALAAKAALVHKARHAIGGADVLTPADIGAATAIGLAAVAAQVAGTAAAHSWTAFTGGLVGSTIVLTLPNGDTLTFDASVARLN